MHNILLIAVDTLRADHLGCYGYHRDVTPHLDRFAAGAVRLDALWSASNFTAPAFTSLFTGLSPVAHGVFDFQSRPRASRPAAFLREAGYRLGGVVAFRFLSRLLRDLWGPLEVVTDTRTGDFAADIPHHVTEGALHWLDRREGGPFCLFLHYNGPHLLYRRAAPSAGRLGPWEPPGVSRRVIDTFSLPPEEEARGRQRVPRMARAIQLVDHGLWRLRPAERQWFVDRYDEAVMDNDAAIGRLLDGLAGRGLLDDTVVAVISDHGEELLDHGALTHGGIHLYDVVVRTVGLLRAPGRGAGVVDRPLSQVDLLPLLVALAEPPALPEDWRGLPDRLLGGGPAEPVFCVGEYKTAVRRGNWKLILALPARYRGRLKRLRLFLRLLARGELRAELYDLATDPGERTNLARRRPDLVRELSRLVRDYWSRPPAGGPGPDREMTAADRERLERELRDLGYM